MNKIRVFSVKRVGRVCAWKNSSSETELMKQNLRKKLRNKTYETEPYDESYVIELTTKLTIVWDRGNCPRCEWDVAEEDYIDANWILNQFYSTDGIGSGKTCRYCKHAINFEPKNPWKISVNRLNNDLSHVRSNCEIGCLSCNIILK